MTQIHSAHHELPETPLFAGLTEDDWPQVLAAGTRVELGAGEQIFRQGAPGLEFFLIVSGAVQVSVESPNGDLPIAQLGAGAVLGEMSLLLEDDHSVSARASTSTTLLRFSSAAFNDWLDERSPTAFRVLRNLANTLAARLRSADAHLVDCSQQDVYASGPVCTDLEKLRKIFLTDWS